MKIAAFPTLVHYIFLCVLNPSSVKHWNLYRNMSSGISLLTNL